MKSLPAEFENHLRKLIDADQLHFVSENVLAQAKRKHSETELGLDIARQNVTQCPDRPDTTIFTYGGYLVEARSDYTKITPIAEY